jgi:hypothetical protein
MPHNGTFNRKIKTISGFLRFDYIDRNQVVLIGFLKRRFLACDDLRDIPSLGFWGGKMGGGHYKAGVSVGARFRLGDLAAVVDTGNVQAVMDLLFRRSGYGRPEEEGTPFRELAVQNKSHWRGGDYDGYNADFRDAVKCGELLRERRRDEHLPVGLRDYMNVAPFGLEPYHEVRRRSSIKHLTCAVFCVQAAAR